MSNKVKLCCYYSVIILFSILSLLLLFSVGICAFRVGPVNWFVWKHSLILVSLCLIISMVGICMILLPDGAKPNILLVPLALFYFVLFFGFIGLANNNDKMSGLFYNTKNIVCVYPDHGDAKKSEIAYSVVDNTDTEVTFIADASALNYDDVVIDNTIKSPKEKLTPTGITLLIPKSYLRLPDNNMCQAIDYDFLGVRRNVE